MAFYAHMVLGADRSTAGSSFYFRKKQAGQQRLHGRKPRRIIAIHGGKEGQRQ